MENTNNDIKITQIWEDEETLYNKLIEGYLASNHRKKVDVIQKAYNFARRAHQGATRPSGEPYIIHPIEVAIIASQEMGLGSTSICAALLHDVVGNSDYTIEDVENIFGSKVAQIVDGLTKISGGIFGDQASEQAENFKKLLLTMCDDIRVILLKICDRLHNMRTLDRQPANKQYKIAGETLYLYAPLSNRLGLNRIKTELEDLAFKYEHPDSYSNIEKKLAHTREQREELFEQFTAPIRKALDDMGTDYTIKVRVKTPYSIWNKMRNKQVSFEEIFDILAVRIIFRPKNRETENNECFNIYLALTKLYKSHPDRLRDWLSRPKANGYQALHVTLMSYQGRWIEVQIRSDRMDEIAEQGFAAHWKYKAGDTDGGTDGELNDWLCTIKEILDDPQPDAMDFLDSIKLNLFASEIFVFTPKGQLVTMPAGCTALDFAFHIHTFLGTHCIGAKVNHKLVPLSHRLQGGDQVEIITSNSQHVQSSWVNFVSTAKARNKIMAILRKRDRDMQKVGQDKLTEWLAGNNLTLTSSILARLTELHALQHSEHLLQDIGNNTITLGEQDLEFILGKSKKNSKRKWRKYVPFLKSKADDGNNATDASSIHASDIDSDRSIVLTDDNIDNYRFPDSCCHPIGGDDVLGYLDAQNHVEIHLRSCSVAQRLKTTFGHRILDVKWNLHGSRLFEATIEVRGIDRKGITRDMLAIITDKFDLTMRSLSVTSDEGIYTGRVELLVRDKAQLSSLISELLTIDSLQSVSRVL